MDEPPHAPSAARASLPLATASPQLPALLAARCAARRAGAGARRSACRWRWRRRGGPRLARVALGFASLVQTIPGLALLALFYPLLLGALGAGRRRHPGARLPAVAAGARRSMRCCRSCATRSPGSTGIDPAVIEAADGIGMTPAPEAAAGRGAARRAGGDGRHPHRGGVDDRRGDARHHGRPAEPRQSDLRRAADRDDRAGAGRLPRRGRRWRWLVDGLLGAGRERHRQRGGAGASLAPLGADRARRWPPPLRRCVAPRRGDGDDRREELLRAIYPRPR